ncbi:MAG: sulfite exporter TauE/SafE family protein, partial [Ignavibacteriaceae bacterium]|nr:sulfite exporter TauE/SafE family protein [Ignavibacteriaceae bacterium]
MESVHITAGFILGLLGSLHCLGMCGPIALALPLNQTTKASFILSRFLYNFGRVISYSLMGLVFGLLGDRLKLIGLQQFV